MKYWKEAGIIACLFFIGAVLLIQPDPESEKETHHKGEIFSFQEPHMGTLFTFRVWIPNRSVPGTVDECTRYTRQAFDRINELNSIFSDYLVESELSLLSKAPANQPIPVSDELLDVLIRAEELSKITEGAFDVTIGPMVRLWRRCRKSQQLPTELQIQGAKERTGFEKLVIDRDNKTVTKLVEHMVLDLGGIAKGYAADEALDILVKGGFPHALVAASGDIAVGESPPKSRGWTVGLDTMEMTEAGEAGFGMSHAAVSTSGDTERFLIINGQRYSHIVDKNTGLGLTERIAASVIAPTATESDSYATAVNLLGKEKGLALIEATEDFECRIVTIDESGESQITYSSGFPGQ